jgi:hypothetical protein
MNINSKATTHEAVKLANTNRETAVKESKMKVTTPNLIRAAGLSAVVAGTIFAVIQPIHPADVLESVNTSAFITITSFKTVMCLFGIFGIAGLYARQVKETGWLGLVGYVLLTIFYAVQMCFAFMEPLVLPLLTSVSPDFVTSALLIPTGPGPMNLGALATIYPLISMLYLLGLMLFGIAIFRARILSRWAGALLAISGPLAAILTVVAPHQIARLAAMPMGIALIWLGYSLWSERREKVSEPVPGMGNPQLSQTGVK